MKYFFPALGWLAAITLLSTKASVPLPSFHLFQADKLGHAAAYGLLTWLTLWGLAHRPAGPNRLDGAGAFVFAAAYGVLMEFVQYAFFPGRFYEYDDMLANAIGAGIGWIIFVKFRKQA